MPIAYQRIEQKYAIKKGLLYALALQESGKKLPGNFVPWPWTLNVDKVPRRYESRHAVYHDLVRYVAEKKMVDIGLCQINWHWNNEQFGSLWEALDPYRNIEVCAQILKQRYDETQDWWVAVGKYHSPGHKHQQIKNAYKHRVSVHRRWLALNID